MTSTTSSTRLRILRLSLLASAAVALATPGHASATTACGSGLTGCGTATTVTYNGVALTRAGVATNATVNVEIWYLKAPASGTHNVVVTAPNATDVTASSISFTGVNQATPVGTFVSSTGTSASASVTANTVLGEPVVDIMGAVGTTAPTVSGATQTSRNTNNTSSGNNHIVSGDSTAFGQAAPVTMSWTVSSADWAIAALPIKASTALTGVDVDSFTASWRDAGTFLSWRSGYQPNVVGFYVYRSNGSGKRTLLNHDLIEGNALKGTLSSFSWTDATAGWNGDVSYWLEEVSTDGTATWYGPASPVPPAVAERAPTTIAGPDASVDATGAGGTSGDVTVGGATGAPGSPNEVAAGEPQGGCAIQRSGDSLSALRLFLLAGVVWSARRRRNRWILPLLFVALLVGTSLWAPRKAAATGGVTVDATATATGGNGLTFAHTMSASANGLIVVGVVTPINCVDTTSDSGNCNGCGTTCGLDTSSLTSGLLDLWHLDEGTGTTSADSSGNGNTASLVGSGETWGTGYENNAVTGNGVSGSYLQGNIGSWFANNNSLSAAAWVYVTANTNGPVFGVTALSGGGGWNMPFLSVKGAAGASSTAYGYVWNNTPISATVTNNAWHLLVLTYDSTTSTTKFYVDNAAALSGSGAFSPASVQGYSTVYWSTVIPGAKPTGVNSNLLGKIDEVRAYNRALSAAEVTSLYTARLACSASTCAACTGGKTSCSGSCVTTATDTNNCGACGHVCNTANGETCTAGVCVCSNGALTDCSTYCVATTTDPNNCGGCGNTCSNATPTFVDSGLLGYWKLNEGTGTTSADASGNSHTATLVNSPTWSPGYSGNALSFDGATNYMTATIGGTFGTNTNLSATAWVYATSTANGPILGVTSTLPGTAWNMPFLSINGATVYGWVWYGAGGGTAQSATVSLNNWHHLAVTYDPTGSGTQQFYVDGGLIGSQTGVYNPSGTTDYLTTQIQGAKPTGVNTFMNGRVDELRVYSRTLSASELSIMYNARATCSGSACNSTCGGSETSCSTVCTLTSVDPNNCGTCGHTCNTAGGESCVAGSCVCPTGQTSCSGVCVDLTSNAAHCGTCTTVCNTGGGESCIASSCGCSSGTDCSTVCVNTTTDNHNCGTCGFTCSTTTCTSCGQDLVGLWHLDDGSGSTAADSSGAGHTATLVTSPVWTSPGETGAGSSLTYSSTTHSYSYATLGTAFANNNKLSAAAWVYATSTTNGPIFGVTSIAGGGGWDMPFLSINGSTVYGWMWQVNGNTPLSATVSLNAWHFLAITYDPTGSGTERFYVDGVQSSTATGTFVPATSQGYSSVFWTTYIPGATPSGVSNYLNGQIDEVRAFTHVLSAGEVKLLYDARQTCAASSCSACPTGTSSCSGACTNTLVDKNNCSATGACGTVCMGAQTCVSGTCM